MTEKSPTSFDLLAELADRYGADRIIDRRTFHVQSDGRVIERGGYEVLPQKSDGEAPEDSYWAGRP